MSIASSKAKAFVSNDRVLVLKPKEGKKATNSIGGSDPRIFTGENKLHALRDNNGLWSLRLEMGITPQTLQGRFTNFEKAYNYAEKYFDRRNVDIQEVLEYGSQR